MDKPVKIRLRRHPKGIKLTIKVSSEIEEFFRHWGGGVEEGPTHGRLWSSLDGQNVRLWSFAIDHKDIDPVLYSALTNSGMALSDLGRKSINISFMRLVGASQGRSILIDSVSSTEGLANIANQLTKLANDFYVNYIKPVDINCYVGVVDYSRVPPEVPRE